MKDQEARPEIHYPFTILVAAVAFACGRVARDVPWVWIGLMAAASFAAIWWFLVARALAALVFGVRCPTCGQPTLGRRAVVGFGDRFYACSSCGARWKRKMIGPWLDASGPEFAPQYRDAQSPDPWSLPPDPDVDIPILSPTHAALVHQRRLRHPDQPNGPGLMP